jgi:hypothetical protein
VCALPSTLLRAEGEKSLKETCERLEQQANAETFQQAVNDCQEVTGGKCKHLLDEEDSLVLERFYHSYADSLQRLAAKMENPEYKKQLEAKALDHWEQYFEWLRNLPEDERGKLMTSTTTRKGKKVWTAAAAIGISALAADRPESAYVDYERLEPEYFGADALNWWFASLFYPDQPDTVDETIFRKIGEAPQTIRGHCANVPWKQHWFAFVDKVRVLSTSGRFGSSRENHIHRIDQIVRSTADETHTDRASLP